VYQWHGRAFLILLTHVFIIPPVTSPDPFTLIFPGAATINDILQTHPTKVVCRCLFLLRSAFVRSMIMVMRIYGLTTALKLPWISHPKLHSSQEGPRLTRILPNSGSIPAPNLHDICKLKNDVEIRLSAFEQTVSAGNIRQVEILHCGCLFFYVMIS